MPEEFALCSLSEAVNWQIMPWGWFKVSIWWIQVLMVYLKASSEARKEQKPLAFHEAAPHLPSAADAARHLAENANRVWRERYEQGKISYAEYEQHLTPIED